MDTLREVKSWMNWWGWTDGGNPGSVKKDADGKIIAHHGDMTWIDDVQEACDTIERLAVREEIDRRAAASRS